MSIAKLVRDFTEQSSLVELPNQPRLMNMEEVKFITEMVLSELTELAHTVTDDAQEFVSQCMGVDVNKNYVRPTREAELIAEQADSFIDIMYYMLNAAAKKGINLDKIFTVVHNANMNKRVNGKFIVRDDGKVIKPSDWKEPDVVGEILLQMNDGAF